jgi:hypothetical protein
MWWKMGLIEGRCPIPDRLTIGESVRFLKGKCGSQGGTAKLHPLFTGPVSRAATGLRCDDSYASRFGNRLWLKAQRNIAVA